MRTLEQETNEVNQQIEKGIPMKINSRIYSLEINPIEENWFGKNTFGCPVCGYEFVRYSKPEITGKIEVGGADYYIKIPFMCENNHKGKIVFYHHEGFSQWWAERND